MFTPALPIKRKNSAKTIGKQSTVALLSLLIFNSANAATLTSPESSLTQSLDALELTLHNTEKHCKLEIANKAADSKTIPLLLGSPCFWITSSETKSLLKFSYEAVGADNTLLVAGTPLDWSAEKKSYQKLPNNAYCTQHLQGIIISKDQVFAVDEKMIAAHCETELAIDEKIFYAMAHNPERYQEKADIPDATTPEKTKQAENSAAEILTKALPETEEKADEKSFLDSVKEFFSGKDEKTK